LEQRQAAEAETNSRVSTSGLDDLMGDIMGALDDLEDVWKLNFFLLFFDF